VLGRLHLYNALNADAARAWRRDEAELARALAARAEEIERSPSAARVRDAIAAVARSLPADLGGRGTPPALERHIALRARSSWRGLDRAALAREWLARSEAWLNASAGIVDELRAAALELHRAACEARSDLLAHHPPSVTTFVGVVRRMDAISGEVEAKEAIVLVPRDDLERQGLAVLDQPVALLREALPGGGTYVLPMPAVALEDAAPKDDAPSPWEVGHLEEGALTGTMLTARDAEWLDRQLAREPTAVPLAPLKLA
jgi:hypothetical protein